MKDSIPLDEPLFRSVHSALKFAFNHQNPSPPTPLQNLVISSPNIRSSRSDGISLNGQFGSVVAGSILFHVYELLHGEKLTIVGRYSQKIKPREVRRIKVVVENHDGSKKNKWVTEKKDDFDITDNFKMVCINLGDHPDIRDRVEDEHLRSVLIARYFGLRQNMKSLADSMGFTDRWLREINRPVKETLQSIENRAIIMISNKLEDRGFC